MQGAFITALNIFERTHARIYLAAPGLTERSPDASNETIPLKVPRFQGETVITCSAVLPGSTVTDVGPLTISRSVLTFKSTHKQHDRVIIRKTYI